MDVKRSVLWIIFTISLVMLFDNWQREHGRSSLFFPSATSPQTSGIRSSNTRTADLPLVSENRAPDQPGAPAGEKVHVKTDVYDIQIDTRGGTLSKLRLVRPGGTEKSSLSMTLFDERPAHPYLARTGLVGAHPGTPFPITMIYLRCSRVRANSRTARIRWRYSLNRPSKAAFNWLKHIDSRPAVYTSQQRLQKISFGDIDKGKAEYTAQADNGWIAMTQYHFASAWIAPQG